jgi:tetratricopeptide (TPR) repeat protein
MICSACVSRGAEMLRSRCKLLCAVVSLCLLGILIVAPGPALAQEEVARCSGKTKVAPSLIVSACTALIEAGVYSGKDLASTFNNRGLAYQMNRDYARSIADFDESIRLDPTHVGAYYNRARSHYLLKDYERAMADYDQAITLNPKDAGAYLNRGNVHTAKGDYDRAIADFGEAIRINPGEYKAFCNRCDALLEIGQAEAALADCNEALRLRPAHGPSFLLRGNANFALARFEQAVADFDAVLQQNPKDAWALYGRGAARMKRGDAAGGGDDIKAAKALFAGIEEDFASYFGLN